MKRKELKCLTTIFLTGPRGDREKLIHVKGSRGDGGCDSWLRSCSPLLWLSGSPGKRKTMLSIFLAEERKQRRRSRTMQCFCDNNDGERNTAVAIIRGLIFQLLGRRSKLFDCILPSFKIHKEPLTSSSFEALGGSPRVWFVILFVVLYAASKTVSTDATKLH
jgi:hypothetical protein